MPEIQHDSRQRALCIVGPHATGEYERCAGFAGQTQLASERRTRSVEWSIRLRRHFLQLTFRCDLLLCRSHLNQDAIRAVSIYFLSRLRVGTQNESRDAGSSEAEGCLSQKISSCGIKHVLAPIASNTVAQFFMVK